LTRKELPLPFKLPGDHIAKARREREIKLNSETRKELKTVPLGL